MKSKPRSPFYFSAYPLKAISNEVSPTPSTNQSPYLKAILSGKTRTLSRVRVFPMINPYRKFSIPAIEESNVKNNEQAEKDWFNNYE